MTDLSKPWGTLEIDGEAIREFIEVTAQTTVAEAADRLRGVAFARFSYLVLHRGGGQYAVIGWNELERLTEGQGDVGSRAFGDLLASWPSVGAATRGVVGIQQIRSDARSQPGERLVILDSGRVVALYAVRVRGSDTLSNNDLLSGPTAKSPTSMLPEPGVLSPHSVPPTTDAPQAGSSEPPQERLRQINALIDGGKGSSNTNPLAVDKRYVLRFNVDYADVAQPDRLGGGRTFSAQEMEAFATPDQTVVDMVFQLDDPLDQVEILGPREFSIRVPIAAGPSDCDALFQIKPRVVGDAVLMAQVIINGRMFQKIELVLVVAASEAAQGTSKLPDDQRMRSTGFTLSQLAALPPRANPLSLIITFRDGGYDMLLVGGTTVRARIEMTEHAIADVVEQSREMLLKTLVHATDTENRKPYIRGWEVDAQFNQQTMEALAKKGRKLFEDLFFSSGADAALIGDYLERYSRKTPLNIDVVGKGFIFPWALIYDKPADEPVSLDGFWGFRHVIQCLPEGGMPDFQVLDPVIDARNGVNMAFFFNENIDREMAGHNIISGQRDFFKNIEGVTVAEYKTEGDLVTLLDNAKNNAQIVYIYCHAESFKPDETDRYNVKKLASDSRLILTKDPGASVRWLEENTSKRFKVGSAPLVFISACQSAELSPFLYQGLVPYFIRKGARGVLGTEVDTPALFAAEFAKRFFTAFLAGGQPLGQLLLDVRREFATEHHNIVGLLYTLYSSGDISLTRS